MMIVMGHFQFETFHDSICNRKPNEFTAGKELLNEEGKIVSLSQSSLAANCWKAKGYNQRYHCIFHLYSSKLLHTVCPNAPTGGDTHRCYTY